MVSRIDRYLFRQLLTASLVAVGAVMLVVWFSQSLRLLGIVVDSGASLFAFVHLMLLSLPTFLSLVLPIGLAIGVMFTYLQLQNESELIVGRALGLSPWQLAKPALALAVLTTLVGLTFTTWISPLANRELVRLQGVMRDDFVGLLNRPGLFTDVANGVTFYARERGEDGKLYGILLHDMRNKNLPMTLMAERGFITRRATDNAPVIIVEDGMRQTLNRDDGRLEQLDFTQYSIDLRQVQGTMNARWPDPRERSMRALAQPTGTDQHAVIRRLFFAEYHSRLALPFLSLAFTAIGLATLLRGEFNRRGSARRIVAGSLIIVAVQGLSMWATNLTSNAMPFVLLLYGLVTVPILGGLWLLQDRTRAVPALVAAGRAA